LENSCASSVGVCAVGYCCIDGLSCRAIDIHYSCYWCQEQSKYFIGDIFIKPRERSQTRSLLKFITAQSIQIIEGAVVTHSNALSAFHYLKGIYVPMSHLSVDMEAIRHCRQSL
jgi:hypothetical protein